jgi:protein SCO1/2
MSDRFLLIVAVVLAALTAGLALFWQPDPPERPLPVAGAPTGGEFTLASADGPVSTRDYRGKLLLVYFGYTFCPDICPTALATIAEGLRQLSPADLARVGMIFVSVDPGRDTPARLKDYAGFFHPAIVGVTGSSGEVAEAARRFGAVYARQAAETAGGYVVDHSSDTYVVGPSGQLVGRIAHATPPDQVAAALHLYLNPQ